MIFVKASNMRHSEFRIEKFEMSHVGCLIFIPYFFTGKSSTPRKKMTFPFVTLKWCV